MLPSLSPLLLPSAHPGCNGPRGSIGCQQGAGGNYSIRGRGQAIPCAIAALAPSPRTPRPRCTERLAHSQRQLQKQHSASSLPQDGRWTYSADHNTLLDGDNINNWLTVVPRDSSPEVGGAGTGGWGRGVQSRKSCGKCGGQPYMHALLRRPPQLSHTHALCGADHRAPATHMRSATLAA